MSQQPITGVVLSNTGSNGWLDGLRDLVFEAGSAAIRHEFPEQVAVVDQGITRDSGAEKEKATGSFFNTFDFNQDVAISAGIAIASIALGVYLYRSL